MILSTTSVNQADAFIRTADLLFPGDKSQVRVADLGCLDGRYSFAFAKAGYQVLGIDARSINLATALVRKSELDLTNVEFVKDDVRHIKHYGRFDIVLCAGLLYHLDEPVAFLKQLSAQVSKLLILQSHYAPARRLPTSFNRIRNLFRSPEKRKVNIYKNLPLSKMCVNEEKEGRWFTEFRPNVKKDTMEGSSMASYGNHRSFWLTKKALLQSLRETGFQMILEQYDFLDDDISRNTYIEDHSRSLFLGIKPPQN
jgi:SAM-dependent methyltransferase